MNYIDVVYKDRPPTTYPYQLCEYLFNRFNIKKGMKLLDIGCGKGEFSRAFQSFGLYTFAIDKEFSSHHYDCYCDYLNIEKDKLKDIKDNEFDIIFMKSIIEHISNPENLMKECYRILRPKGMIITLTPDWNSQMNIFYDDYTHRQPYTKKGINDLLKIFNFKNIETELFYQLPILWKYPKLKIISKILRKFVSANSNIKNKFIRWSIELMILGVGIK